MHIRPETPADAAAICSLTQRAFAGLGHSDATAPHIVAALRAANALAVSLVAEIEGALVGHVALCAVSIGDGTPGWYGLGPISVEPALQARGLGLMLMHAGLDALTARGAAGCVVLGDPGFCRRFGFAANPELVYPGAPAGYFMSRAFGASRPRGVVDYKAAFFPAQLRRATAQDASGCVQLRGATRENAISEARLREYGITAQSWAQDIDSGALPGWVAFAGDALMGYCFGAADSGEVVVLAIRPSHEGQGLGKALLACVVQDLRALGHTRLFLGCSADPGVRSFGFYRHQGWRGTGTLDARGDELLELHLQPA